MIYNRKKTLIIEKTQVNNKKKLLDRFSEKLLKKNKFIVELEDQNNNKQIDECRIKAFKLSYTASDKTLNIWPIIDYKDWVTEFIAVNIARIYIFDRYGNELNFFDYDIISDGFFLEAHTDLSEILPVFNYKILS